MRSPLKERKRKEGKQIDRRRAKYGSLVKKKRVEYDRKKRATKCCKKAPKERTELEEGEVSGEESSTGSIENPLPVCRFFVRNKCMWGHVCRYKHPPYKSTGNYVMFEPVKLPKALPIPYAPYEPPPPPSPTWLAPTEQNDSFDNHLSDLKKLMRTAGYKVTKPKVINKPWIEFNDLDTDPYYSQQSPPQQAAEQPWSLEPQRQVTLLINSDSSTPDYSSTTNSLTSTSSSSMERTRKRPSSRKHHLLSSSSASSVSESSSTHSSEQSFISYRERSRNKHHRESSSVSFRALNRSRITRLKYLESKLKDIEERIYMKRARRK